MDPIVVTQAMNVIYSIATLMVIVLGLAIVFGWLGVMNLAHGEFIMIGAYAAFFTQAQGWPYLAAVPVALVACGALALLMELALIRPLYNRPFDTLLATWGVSLLLREGVDTIYGTGFKSLTVPISGSVDVLGAPYPAYRVVLIVISIAAMAALIAWYLRSRTGARIKAMVGNPALAQAVGIRTDRLARATFVVGIAFAGLAGVMVAPLVPVHPFMGLDFVLTAFFVIVVGGLGSVLGLVSGAAIIGGTQSAVSAVLDNTFGYFTVLLIAIFFLWRRPRGLFARA